MVPRPVVEALVTWSSTMGLMRRCRPSRRESTSGGARLAAGDEIADMPLQGASPLTEQSLARLVDASENHDVPGHRDQRRG